jgi:large subunit ribosomal protein L37Ae
MTKLKSASRYGARYSTPLKQVVMKIEQIQKSKQICPQCKRKSLKRRGYSLWICSKCGAKIAGGAYEPQTGVGQLVERIVRKGETIEEASKDLATVLKEEKAGKILEEIEEPERTGKKMEEE